MLSVYLKVSRKNKDNSISISTCPCRCPRAFEFPQRTLRILQALFAESVFLMGGKPSIRQNSVDGTEPNPSNGKSTRKPAWSLARAEGLLCLTCESDPYRRPFDGSTGPNSAQQAIK